MDIIHREIYQNIELELSLSLCIHDNPLSIYLDSILSYIFTI